MREIASGSLLYGVADLSLVCYRDDTARTTRVRGERAGHWVGTPFARERWPPLWCVPDFIRPAILLPVDSGLDCLHRAQSSRSVALSVFAAFHLLRRQRS